MADDMPRDSAAASTACGSSAGISPLPTSPADASRAGHTATVDVRSDAAAAAPPRRRALLWSRSVPRAARVGSALVCAAWAAMCPVFAAFAPRFTGALTSTFEAAGGSPSDAAQRAQAAHFPATQHSSSIVVFVQSARGGAVAPADPRVAAFSRALNASAAARCPPSLRLAGVAGYYLSDGAAASQLVSADNQSTVLLLQLGSNTDQTALNDFIGWLQDYAGTGDALPSRDYWVGVTGPDVLQYDANEGTLADTERVDMMTFPIAFFILACFLRSARLMVFPLLTIGVCLGATFSICYGVATVLSVESVTPALVMAATLAFNIDYNLFLLSRFRDNARVLVVAGGPGGAGCEIEGGVVGSVTPGGAAERAGIRRGWELHTVDGERVCEGCADVPAGAALGLRMSLWDNVWGSVVRHTAGETVLLSGALVTLAFFALTLVPLSALYGMGVCGGVAVAVCVAVNCTLTPALLLVFGEFFARPSACGANWLLAAWSARRRAAPAGNDAEQALLPDAPAPPPRSLFRALGDALARRPLAVAALALAAAAPLYAQFPRNLDAAHINADPLEFAPRTADSVAAWRRIAEHFDAGKFQPYSFILVNTSAAAGAGGAAPAGPSGIFSAEGYDAARDLVLRVSAGSGVPVRAFSGPVVLPVAAPPLPAAVPVERGDGWTMLDFGSVNASARAAAFAAFASGARACAAAEPDVEKRALCAEYESIVAAQVSAARDAMTIQCFVPFDPTGLEAMRWIGAVRSALGGFRAAHPALEAHLAGGNAMMYDFNDAVNDSMPRMIAILLATVTLVVCAVFRSFPIAAIMAVTIAYSVGSAFGVAYYAYQTGGFTWMFPFLPDFHNQGLNWSVVPMCVSITVALTMDYDVFILTRVYELRRKGRRTADAVKEGLRDVGTTLVGAGCIMVIAFGSLMLTSVVALNQIGLILVVSVAIDTLVAAPVVVPALMLALGDRVWLPARQAPGGAASASADDGGDGAQCVSPPVSDAPAAQ